MVGHTSPPERRFHGGLVIGAADRGVVDAMLKADSVATLIQRQAEVISAAHAYTIERSDTVIDNVCRPRGDHSRRRSR